jgi:hypothetical protein
MAKHLVVCDKFFSGAPALRRVFDQRFADPRATSRDRFVWDYWHVPHQYTLVRTAAQNFFPEPIYKQFLLSLLTWGEENLGCRAISPPWLSFYVDGCSQELHADIPHGPWSFVYSLTPWAKRKFTGGQTVIAKPKLLDYWGSLAPSDFHESKDFFTEIPALFNRLVVFDPRLPHGVKRVSGVQDPREARLVMHGWFTQPTPYVDGYLSAVKVSQKIEPWEDRLRKAAHVARAQGVLTLRLSVNRLGQIVTIKMLNETLVGCANQAWLRPHMLALKQLKFATAQGPSKITLPFYLG